MFPTHSLTTRFQQVKSRVKSGYCSRYFHFINLLIVIAVVNITLLLILQLVVALYNRLVIYSKRIDEVVRDECVSRSTMQVKLFNTIVLLVLVWFWFGYPC